MEKAKITKKGSRSYGYQIASWRKAIECAMSIVYLGSCAKMNSEDARQKARKMKLRPYGSLLELEFTQ